MKLEFDTFQKTFAKNWTEYIELHKELDKYRGKEIGSDVDAVNKILHALQDKFFDIYPCLQFIAENHTLAVTAVNDYAKFIDDIKAAGGSQSSSIIEA